jgi:hypothetical protein
MKVNHKSYDELCKEIKIKEANRLGEQKDLITETASKYIPQLCRALRKEYSAFILYSDSDHYIS